MVSQTKEEGGSRKERYYEDHSFTLDFCVGEAGEIQGQDIVGEPILASLFVYAF